jgi:uncharacterized membrane protein
MALSDDVEKLAKNQATLQKNFITLKTRLDALERRVGEPKNVDTDDTLVAEPFQTRSAKASARAAKESADDTAAKETSKPIENLGFKIFGAVGFLLILLGLFFLYRYAVDNGYLGITGRIAIGTLFAIVVLVTAEAFRRKSYEKFSQLLTGGGLALLYFTFYATYAFTEYREALGMTQGVNATLLFIVMIIAVLLALRHDSQLLTCFAFLMGYLAPLLTGAAGDNINMHGTMIVTIILTIGMGIILARKRWPLLLYPVLLAHLVYLIAFFSERVIQYSPAGTAPSAVAPALLYLVILFIITNVLAILLGDADTAKAKTAAELKAKSDKRSKNDDAAPIGPDAVTVQSVIAAVLSGGALLAFGLTTVWHYWSSWRGVSLVIGAALYLGLTALAKQRDQRTMFETFFLLCITFITIAIPVQLKHSWIALAWAVEGYLLVRAGERVQTRGIRILGYVALFLALCNTLGWGMRLPLGERLVSSLVVLAGIWGAAYTLRDEKDAASQTIARTILAVVGLVLLVIIFTVEPLAGDSILKTWPMGARHTIVSVLWAATAVACITIGFVQRSGALRIVGAILFGITVLKVLIIDLDNLDPIYRTLVTIIVGIIALAGAFAYIKNKDRIKAYLEQ